MLYKTSLAGLACAIGLSTAAFGQGFGIPWAPYAGVGGAIGGYSILGSSRHDNAPLEALYLDRYAHVSGNYSRAIVKFDRVVRWDGSVVIMRRASQPGHPEQFGYLPPSWPAVGAIGIEHVRDASGRIVSDRTVVIPQSQVMAARIPVDGPPVVTLAFERNIMPDGAMVVTASAQPADPGVEYALLGTQHPDRYFAGIGRNPTLAKGLPWDSKMIAVASAR